MVLGILDETRLLLGLHSSNCKNCSKIKLQLGLKQSLQPILKRRFNNKSKDPTLKRIWNLIYLKIDIRRKHIYHRCLTSNNCLLLLSQRIWNTVNVCVWFKLFYDQKFFNFLSGYARGSVERIMVIIENIRRKPTDRDSNTEPREANKNSCCHNLKIQKNFMFYFWKKFDGLGKIFKESFSCCQKQLFLSGHLHICV